MYIRHQTLTWVLWVVAQKEFLSSFCPCIFFKFPATWAHKNCRVFFFFLSHSELENQQQVKLECLGCTGHLHILSVADETCLNIAGHPPFRTFWDRAFKSATDVPAPLFPSPPPQSLFSFFSFSQPISWSESCKRKAQIPALWFLTTITLDSHFPALNLSFLICKMGSMFSLTWT